MYKFARTKIDHPSARTTDTTPVAERVDRPVYMLKLHVYPGTHTLHEVTCILLLVFSSTPAVLFLFCTTVGLLYSYLSESFIWARS
jgi:hypothetical protein